MITLPQHIQDLTLQDIDAMMKTLRREMQVPFIGFPDEMKSFERRKKELSNYHEYLHRLALDKTVDMVKRLQENE